MQFRRSPGMRPIDADWHRRRQTAREQAFSSTLDGFFSETEQIKYNLDTAQIDGSDNPQLWRWNRTLDVLGINGVDVRDLRDR